MPKAAIKILNSLSVMIIEKYKPVIIGVFDDGKKGEYAMMVKKALEGKFDVCVSPLIINGNTGIAKAIIDFFFKKSQVQPNMLVLRLGVSQGAYVKKMLKILHPDIVVFGRGNENDEKGMAGAEKSLLFRSLKKNVLAVCDAEDKTLNELADKSRCSKMTFGFGTDAMVKGHIFESGGEDEQDSREGGTTFKITYDDSIVPFHLASRASEEEVRAALAAVAVSLHLGSNMIEISEALRK